MNAPATLNTALFGIAIPLAAVQRPRTRLLGYLQEIEEQLSTPSLTVLNGGLVDSLEKSDALACAQAVSPDVIVIAISTMP
jgi:L-arabinose isomerase